MEVEYSVYQKFTDLDIANDVADELRSNGIEVIVQESNKSSVGNFAATSIDFDAAINLKPRDFDQADKVLEIYYSKLIENVEEDYYLFDFTREELFEIVSKPYDWGHFDVLMAKNLLNDKGEKIDSEIIKQNKRTQVSAAAEIESVSRAKIILGYVFSFLFPLIGFVIGYSIVSNKKMLPNGYQFALHSSRDINHGKQILTTSIYGS